MEAIDIAELHTWARECGAYALSRFKHVVGRRKPDRSYVTDVDEEIERLLVSKLSQRYPAFGIVGEERARAAGAQEWIWAIDPIDGTASFVSGLPIWGVSIGLLRQGKPYLGVFYMPVVDELYWNVPGEGAYLNDERLQVIAEREWDSEDWITVPSNVHRRYQIDFRGKTRSLGSAVADLCYTARGSALGSLLGRCAIWDVTGGLAIAGAAGAAYTGLSGRQPNLLDMLDGTPLAEPIVVAQPGHMERLRTRIKYD